MTPFRPADPAAGVRSLKYRGGMRQQLLVRCGPPVENLAADGPNR